MNKKFLIAIPLCLLGFYGTSQVTAQDPECEVVSVPPTCQGASRININTNSRNISPRNICVSPGQTFDVDVRPTGSVTIRGKDGGWPDASGASFRPLRQRQVSMTTTFTSRTEPALIRESRSTKRGT